MRSEAYEQLVQYKLDTNNAFVAFFVVMCKNFSYQARMCWSRAQSQIYLHVKTILHTGTKLPSRKILAECYEFNSGTLDWSVVACSFCPCAPEEIVIMLWKQQNELPVVGKGLLPSNMYLYANKRDRHPLGLNLCISVKFLLNFVICRVCHRHIINAVFCLADQWRRRAITVHWLFISWDCCAMLTC